MSKISKIRSLVIAAFVAAVLSLAAVAAPDCARLLKAAEKSLEYVATAEFASNLVGRREFVSLLRSVKRFEKAGGRGAWTAARTPFDIGDESLPFYRILGVPDRVDPASDFHFLRTSEDLALTGEIVKDRGTPLYVTALPEGTAQAFVVSSNYETATRLLAVDKSPHRSVLVVQPAGERFVMSHEFRHWIDRETPAFSKDRETLLTELVRVGFTADETGEVWQCIDEWRGHSAQEKAILSARRKHEAFTPSRRTGLVLHPKKSDYDFEIALIAQAYEQLYGPRFRAFMSKLKRLSPEVYENTLAKLKEWELSKGNFSLANLGIR